MLDDLELLDALPDVADLDRASACDLKWLAQELCGLVKPGNLTTTGDNVSVLIFLIIDHLQNFEA